MAQLRPAARGLGQFARLTLYAAMLSIGGIANAKANAADTSEEPVDLGVIQVTVSRREMPVEIVPASISVVSGEDLRVRGANDLRTALTLVAGVDVAPGGDGGPASSVPALWGLREFDAFLLAVDGVPWGGAFNPALASLVLSDVERIEVLRGAAPVMYGATAFVGVINVIHKKAGTADQAATVSYGSFNSATFAGSVVLPSSDEYQQSLAVDAERRRFADDRAAVDRAHALYRAAFPLGPGEARLDIDVSLLNQKPKSPHLRRGPILAPDMPIDANYNPSDARLDENRYHLAAGYDQLVGEANWSTVLALTSTSDDIVRGFVDEEYFDDGSTPNAAGFTQDRDLTDGYFDTHFEQVLDPGVDLTYGFDYLYGKAKQTSYNFDYYVSRDATPPPLPSSAWPVSEIFSVEDERNFMGAYAQLDWQLTPDVTLLAGLRLNYTSESRDSEAEGEEMDGGDIEEMDHDSRSKTRLGGAIGISWRAWQDGGNDLVLYADYRNTYKPAAIDFGPESEAEILEPETAESIEAGLKSRLLDGRLEIDLSLFDMNFNNLVVSQTINGRPGLVNAGEEHFKGAELEVQYALMDDLLLVGDYALHSAKFGDYEQSFDGVLTQLDGNYLEMSPRHLGGLGLIYQPATGLYGSVVWDHVGSRYLTKRNTAEAPAYDTLDANLGVHFDRWNVNLVGHNLTDERPPVSESELGESQYYLLPARTIELYVGYAF